ncbi:ParB/RepB/Spo0J family partition protein [Hydrogenimonas sp.]
MGKKGKSKSLGRGLGAILGEVAEAYENEFKSDEEALKEAVMEIPVERIRPNPYQPRKHFDERALEELAESIRRHGLLQPVVVIEEEDGYMLIAGERRVRASELAGLTSVRAIVADIDESRFRELALIENIQRESLNPIELAHSYKELIEEYGITQEELAKIIHKSRSHIANTMRLLQLDGYVIDKVASGQVSQGHAKILVGLDPKEQRIVCDTIVGQKLSVREAEALVGGMKPQKERKSGAKEAPKKGIDLSAYREVIEENVPFRISVKRSKVEISFENEEELKDFLRAFAKKA